jgi:ATP-binding cassette subfamily C (CFTR/MRP) protein 1
MAFYSEQQQQVLFETGSFTGFRPLRELGANYFSTISFKQPLCGNSEGWGPLSPHRYDFTPCFIDVWIAAVSVFGLLFGSLAVWWLLVKKQKQEGQTKNVPFYIKQVNIAANDS